MEWPVIIETLEAELGISEMRGELAKRLGIRSGIISDIKNGKAKNPGSNIALLLINKLGVNPRWLENEEPPVFVNYFNSKPFAMSNLPSKNGQSGVPIIQGSVPDGLIIPYLEQPVSAGPGASLEEVAVPDRFLTVPKELARYKALNALPVRGDSMSPTLHEGDMVVCDSGGWDGDGVYVIRTQEQAFVKRVILTPSGYQVISDNKLYPPYSGNREEVVIVGKVRCAVIRLE